MDSQIRMDDLNKIEAGIRKKYSEVAKSPEGQFQYPTGRKGLETLNYDKTLIAAKEFNLLVFFHHRHAFFIW